MPNLEFGPFADKAVRQALYLAMNKQAHHRRDLLRPAGADRILPAAANPGPINAGPAGPQATIRRSANKLLDEAGWMRGADGHPREERRAARIRHLDHDRQSAAASSRQQLLMQDWQQIGASMKINNMPAAVIWGDFWQQLEVRVACWSASNFMHRHRSRRRRRASPATRSRPRAAAAATTCSSRTPRSTGCWRRAQTSFDQEKRKAIYSSCRRSSARSCRSCRSTSTVRSRATRKG